MRIQISKLNLLHFDAERSANLKNMKQSFAFMGVFKIHRKIAGRARNDAISG